jgi:hypothetical protein
VHETDILTLGPDSDWCDTAVWSGDSATVAFLVQHARRVLVDAKSARVTRPLGRDVRTAELPLAMFAPARVNVPQDTEDALFRLPSRRFCSDASLQPRLGRSFLSCGYQARRTSGATQGE